MSGNNGDQPDDQTRANACMAELDMVLKKFDCHIMTQLVFVNTKMASSWLVAANTRPVKPEGGNNGMR